MCESHAFQFDFTRAYVEQFVRFFEQTPMHSLSAHEAPREFGVYALYRRRHGEVRVVYVGKADSKSGRLKGRLDRHLKKIKATQGIPIGEIGCRFVVVPETWVVAAAAAEAVLTRKFQPPWNGSGFGSNTPGRGRPGIRRSRWDAMFPPRSPSGS